MRGQAHRRSWIGRSILAATALAAAANAALAAGVSGYYRQPSVHNDRVVFNSEGDLWSVSTQGGLAGRLTSHPANEAWPSFSPDGKWLAFTADYQGNSDVYVMPADGGEPRRLTFHPSNEAVVGWSTDGQNVLFRARRTGNSAVEQIFSISLKGGEPRLLPIGRAGLGSYSPDGSKFAFVRNTWFANWRRYRGGTAPQLWVGDLKAGTFSQISKDPAVHNHPMWVGDRLYYVTERDGNLNLFSSRADGSDEKQHTAHKDYDVRFAQTDGKQIAYIVGADLWLLDLATDQARKLDVTISSDRIRSRPRAEDAADTLDRFELSSDGKRILVSSRGDLWSAPSKPGGRVIQLTQSSGIRDRQAVYSPDDKKVAFITDETGEQELKILDATGKDLAGKVITSAGKGWLFPPEWSPDGKHLAYADLTCTLYVVNAESGERTQVEQSPVWEIREYAFSPDGKWLAYTVSEANGTQSVNLFNVEDGRRATVSNGFSYDSSPAWDPTGKYLYFSSSRYWNPLLDDLDREFVTVRSSKLCLAILSPDGKSPFLPEDATAEADKKEKEDDKADTDDKKGDGPTTAPSDDASDEEPKKSDDEKPADKPGKGKKKLPEVKLDPEGLADRVIEVPNVKPGNIGSVAAVEGKVFFIDRPSRGMSETEGLPWNQRGGVLHVYNVKDKKAETYLPSVTAFAISADGKKIAWRDGEAIKVGDTSAGKAPDDPKEKLALNSLPLMVDTSAEWAQIYAEAWRLQRDFYWAENMVGVPWSAVREKYKPLVARVGSRGELNDLVGQLIGELGTSHTYVMGGDANFQPPKPVAIGMLGADIDVEEATGLHRFARVLRPERWETDVAAPLTMTHANVRDGDYLLAINGRELGPNDSVDERLANLAGVEVLLTVASKADKSDARDIQITTLSSEFDLRYADMLRRNREYVHERSSGRIGYFHLPDMGRDGLVQFVKGFYPQFRREALVVDVRNNGGGFVSQMILERLGRKALGFDKARRGIVGTYPERAHVGPKVCLIDQNSGSDGDIFPYNFRKMGLGPLIGKRSWGGVVGIRSDKGFIDGGMSTQPEFALFSATDGWNIEGYGVDPDIEIDIRPEDEVAGRDPQLDRGIDELMKKLAETPGKLPEPPPLPVRVGPAANLPQPQDSTPRPAAGNGTGAPTGSGSR